VSSKQEQGGRPARPLGHGPLLEGLWRAAADGRLPHGLLLRGARGVGKFLSARWLAAGLFCKHGPGWPCGECGPCKRAWSGNHPDLFVVDAPAVGQDAITIAFVTHRELRSPTDYDGPDIEQFLSLRAMEGGWRVVIVREAERMNVPAQNAFLKTLEEPGQDALLLLECSEPSNLLETIRSRVIPVGFERLDAEDTVSVLRTAGLEGPDAQLLARWSAGAPGQALTLAARGAPLMREILLGVMGGERSPAEASIAVWEVAGDYPGKTPAAQRRLRARTLLDVGLELWLDLERVAAGVEPGDLPHGVRLAELPPLSPPDRERRREAWFLARQDVALNLTPEVLVSRALAAAGGAPGY
jgi:DNA polymerase III subunit delta'